MEKKKKKKRLSLFVDSQLVDTGVEGNAAILIYLTQTCQWGVLITVMVITNSTCHAPGALLSVLHL